MTKPENSQPATTPRLKRNTVFRNLCHYINGLPPDTLFTTRDVLHCGLRSSVDTVICRLVRMQLIERHARGVFLRTRGKTKEPTLLDIATVKAKSFFRQIYTTGAQTASQILGKAPNELDKAKPETEAEAQAWTNAGIQAATHAGIQAWTHAETQAEIEANPKAKARANAHPQAERQAEAATKGKVNANANANAQTQANANANAKTQTNSNAKI